MHFLSELLEVLELKLLLSFIGILLFHFLRQYFRKFINKRVKDPGRRFFWRQFINYVFLFSVAILVILLWRRYFSSIVTVLSFVGAALTIVSKELILNLIANSVIIWRGLFDIGDRIHIGEHSGDVIATGPIFFTLAEIGNWVKSDEHTARIIKIPNSLVLTTPVANYSKGLSVIWNDLIVEVSLDSNLQKAKTILQEIANQLSYKFSEQELFDIRAKTEELMFHNIEPFVRMRLKDGKVIFEIRYACKNFERSKTEDLFWQMILERFKNENDIKLI